MRQTSILIISLILITTPVFADVFIDLPDTTAYPGDTLKIPVTVSDLTGLEIYSYQFKIEYDSTIVNALGVDAAGSLTGDWDKTWINTDTPGQIILGNYGISPLQNSGALIYIIFQCSRQIDGTTQLKLGDVEFNAGSPIAVVTDGSLKILHPPIRVSFNSNIHDTIKILIDGAEKMLPFDSTWVHGDPHTIGIELPHYKSADARLAFDNWSDGGDTTHVVTPISDTTYTVNIKEEYMLTLDSEYGTVRGNGWYARGTEATFSVDSLFQPVDNMRYIFKMWHGTGTSSYSGSLATYTIIMNEPVTETAEWARQYLLTIDSPHGNPVGGGWHDEGDTVRIAVDSLDFHIQGTRYVFKFWSGTGNGSYSGKDRTAEVVVSEPIVEQALWATEFYLWIKTKPAGITTFLNEGWYAQNETATTDSAKQVVTTTDYVYQFLNWSADGKPTIYNPVQILMDTSHTAEAVYLVDSVSVSITTNIGQGTFVWLDGKKYPAPFSMFKGVHSEMTIGIDTTQYNAEMTSRYIFDHWSDGGKQSHPVKADSALKLTAFLATQHTLSVDTHPSGLIDFKENGWYDHGDTVDLAPAPEQTVSGQDTLSFKGWQLDNMPVTGNPIQVFMDCPHAAIALYSDLYSITGKVADRRGNPVLNVAWILSGSAQDTMWSLNSNEYGFNFLIEGNYLITPRLEGFKFAPPFRAYSLLRTSLQDQNFIAIDTLKPSIDLVYPNGGEKLQGAAIDSITWQVHDNVGISLIEIDLSLDNGASWQAISKLSRFTGKNCTWNVLDVTSSQCKIRVRAIDFDGNFAIDMSESVFSIESASGISEHSQQSLPEKFQVLQNYPNPFNSATALRFQIPEACHVVVRIFNIKGQEIVVLLNRELSRGNYQINWDSKDRSGRLVGSGIYFYQVEAASQAETRRMLYLR